MSVSWLDRDSAVRSAERVARELAAAHPEVVRVLLFGSVARRDAVPGSDIDLLVVLRDSDEPFLDRITTYSCGPVDGLTVDVLPYTESEFQRMREEAGVVRAALVEGRWVVGGAR